VIKRREVYVVGGRRDGVIEQGRREREREREREKGRKISQLTIDTLPQWSFL
jgi:hypothetical protein